QGDAILSKSAREELFKPFKSNYAFGWWVVEAPSFGRLIWHGGTTKGFEGKFQHYLDHDLHVVVLCNDRGRSEAAVSVLVEAVLGKHATTAGAPLPEADLKAFAGTYALARGGKVAVHADGDALVLDLDE